jgi:hypothetical protein
MKKKAMKKKAMKKKAKTYTFGWWIGGDYVTLTFNSMEDMHKCMDYIEAANKGVIRNKFPERIKDQMPVEEVCNILGKKLAKLEEVANKLKDIK